MIYPGISSFKYDYEEEEIDGSVEYGVNDGVVFSVPSFRHNLIEADFEKCRLPVMYVVDP